MKKTTEKVSYLNYCLYICGVMKDDDFHRTKTKPNEKLLLLKLKNGKAYAKHLLFKQLCQFYKGGGISSNRFFESVVFMDGVACGDAVFSAIEMNLSSEQNNNRNIGSGWQ